MGPDLTYKISLVALVTKLHPGPGPPLAADLADVTSRKGATVAGGLGVGGLAMDWCRKGGVVIKTMMMIFQK